MANYAFVKDNIITALYEDLPTNWENVSNFYLLKDDIEALNSMGWQLVEKVQPDFDTQTQYLGSTYHRIIDGQVIETQYVIDRPVEPELSVTEPTEQELLEAQIIKHNQAMRELRNTRDDMLAKTDFTQLVDVIEIQGPELSLAYKQYRQALRDLPNTYELDLTFIDVMTARYPNISDFTNNNGEV
jgi:hypothetical protein